MSFLSLHTIGLERRSGLLAVPDIEGLPVLKRWYVVNNLSKTLSPLSNAAEGLRIAADSAVFENGAATLLDQGLVARGQFLRGAQQVLVDIERGTHRATLR